MRTRGNAFLVIAILIAVTLVTVVQTLPPSPLPANAPSAEFSAERAVKHIRVIAGQPRPTGSSANAEARNYILAVLKDLGLETEIQRDRELVNVVGRIVGTRSSDTVLLTAHLDSVAEGPGATDDGSGVAVLLETARALVSDAPLRNTVIFLFTDFEEGGTIGAEAFIADHPWARDVRLVIGFDAGGLSGPCVLSATRPTMGGSFVNWPKRIHISPVARLSTPWQTRAQISGKPSKLPGSLGMHLICIGIDASTRWKITSKMSTYPASSTKAITPWPLRATLGI